MTTLPTPPAEAEMPIACTLEPAQQRSRSAGLSALARRALRSREQTDHGERLTFDGDDQTDRELRATVAAEEECCPFLTLDLRRRGEHLVLEIRGPQEARPIIAQLFA